MTSTSKALENVRIDTIYPHHSKALQTTGIAPKTFPTFKEIENLRNLKTKEEKDKLTEIVSLYGIEEERSIAEDTLLYQLAEEVPHFLQQESGLSPYLN